MPRNRLQHWTNEHVRRIRSTAAGFFVSFFWMLLFISSNFSLIHPWSYILHSSLSSFHCIFSASNDFAYISDNSSAVYRLVVVSLFSVGWINFVGETFAMKFHPRNFFASHFFLFFIISFLNFSIIFCHFQPLRILNIMEILRKI